MSGDILNMGSGPITMSSREIAEICGARHNDVVATIERLFENGVLQESRKTTRTYRPDGGGPDLIHQAKSMGYKIEHHARGYTSAPHDVPSYIFDLAYNQKSGHELWRDNCVQNLRTNPNTPFRRVTALKHSHRRHLATRFIEVTPRNGRLPASTDSKIRTIIEQDLHYAGPAKSRA